MGLQLSELMILTFLVILRPIIIFKYRLLRNVTILNREADRNRVLMLGTRSSGDVFLCKHKTDKNYNYALKKIKTLEID